MYFPYFYGRGAELLALRDIASTLSAKPNGHQKIVPIIESLQANSRPLKAALDVFRTKRMKAYVITNPHHEELANKKNFASWATVVNGDLSDDAVVYPTFMITVDTQLAELKAFLTVFPRQDIGIVVRSNSISPTDLSQAIKARSALIFLHHACDPSQYEAVFQPTLCVRVSESFVAEPRNADYGPPELFSDETSGFQVQGRIGFSDFTLLPKAIPDLSRGGPASAVAIHLSFINPATNHVWVHHYVSNSKQRGVGSVGSKFLEAVDKIENDVRQNPGKYVPSQGLGVFRSFHATAKETNLATSKRHQISHHLETVLSTL